MPRLSLLLAGTCLGSAAILLLGGQLLRLRPPLTPDVPTASLRRIWRLDPDPVRRREAALLLDSASDVGQPNPERQRRWLGHQAWGRDPLAALVLKRQALLAQERGDSAAADQSWQNLLKRFPDNAASADALYALGRQQPLLRRLLLRRFPSHPAALAAAVERAGQGGADHLARWGERWPGAEQVIAQRCQQSATALSATERDQLAGALARLGKVTEAQRCLGGDAGSVDTQLALARVQLRDPDQEEAAEVRLLTLARRDPDSPAARDAVDLLSQGRSATSLAALDQLPKPLQNSAPVQARRAMERGDAGGILRVMRRWPGEPAVWELQWVQARKLALQGDWAASLQLLAEPSLEGRLPAPLEARRWFWQGLAEWQLGNQETARSHWKALLGQLPGGYYGWRAAVRLGQADPDEIGAHTGPLEPQRWHPLRSDDGGLERLWRLGQWLEAWEHWRLQRRGSPPANPPELTWEGRLRRAVGDHWLGLGQLEQASLRVGPQACSLAAELERELHRPAYSAELNQAGQAADVPPTLLAAVAKQESRFSASVRSPVGAIGLLQLMPATAAELAGGSIDEKTLENPARNAELGARYLRQLLDQGQGNPLLAVASYNAGPGAVAAWVSPRLQAEPELWVEAIPYPETRLYVKKVLGNVWSMAAPRPPACPPGQR